MRRSACLSGCRVQAQAELSAHAGFFVVTGERVGTVRLWMLVTESGEPARSGASVRAVRWAEVGRFDAREQSPLVAVEASHFGRIAILGEAESMVVRIWQAENSGSWSEETSLSLHHPEASQLVERVSSVGEAKARAAAWFGLSGGFSLFAVVTGSDVLMYSQQRRAQVQSHTGDVGVGYKCISYICRPSSSAAHACAYLCDGTLTVAAGLQLLVLRGVSSNRHVDRPRASSVVKAETTDEPRLSKLFERAWACHGLLPEYHPLVLAEQVLAGRLDRVQRGLRRCIITIY